MQFDSIDLESWRTEAMQHPMGNNTHIWTGLRRFAKRDPTVRWIRLMVDGKTVGAYLSSIRNSKCKLDLIDVFDCYRGQGYGRCLLEHAIEMAEMHGCKEMTIHGARKARGFYEAFGLTAILKTNFDYYCIELNASSECREQEQA